VPLANPFVEVMHSMVTGNLPEVSLNVLPCHWNGMLILEVMVISQYPSYPPVHFLGWQYVAAIPVPSTTFTCPFVVTYPNGLVHVDWESYCTYPFGPGRSKLEVDNQLPSGKVFMNRGNPT
jgi:hypothetical protein